MKKRGKTGVLLVVSILAMTMLTGCCTFRYLDGSSSEEIEKCKNPLLWNKVATLEGQESASQQALREQGDQLGKLRETVAKAGKDAEITQGRVNNLAAAVGEEGSKGFEQGEMAKERPSTGSVGISGKGSLMKRVAVLEEGMKNLDADVVTLKTNEVVIREGIMGVPGGRGQGATIKAIRYKRGTAGQDKVMVVLDRMTKPRIFSLGGGNSRIVMDFFRGKYGRHLPQQTDIKGLNVQQIRIGKYLKPVPKTRIVIDLVPGKKYFADPVFNKKNKIYTVSISPQE
jgi:hypothetical protein